MNILYNEPFTGHICWYTSISTRILLQTTRCMRKHTAGVIGSGIGGIASAIRLAAKGYRVSVFEQAGEAGGKLSELRSGGFRFDTGPSLFTMPWLVDELFLIAGRNPRDYFNYLPLASSCRYFWEDGTRVTAWKEPGNFARELAQNTGMEPGQVLAFLRKSERLYEITHEIFLFNSLHKAANYTKKAFLKSLLHLHELDAFTSMHKKNSRWFSDPRAVQLFDRYATYNGSDPYKTPATLNVIPHLEHNKGAFFPLGGMYQIAKALYKLAVDMGVEFHFNTPVGEVIIENKRVAGLCIPGGRHEAGVVVSNADIVNLYRNLLPDFPVPKKQRSQQRSSSAVIFYWGINRNFPALGLHNVLFSKDYKAEFEHLFGSKTISPDPTTYIFISARAVPGDAPPGQENWYVMVNAPENNGQDWEETTGILRARLLEKIRSMTGIDPAPHIVSESMADPRSIEAQTGSYRGSLYGLSSNSSFSAFYRHPNFKSSLKNLYFTGGSVHPGGGIPLCLASARIIDREIPCIKHITQP